MPQGRILEVRKICKSFGKAQVLRDVDFDIKKGEVHALIGENGAGKSTLLKILFGIHRHDGGEICMGDSVVSFLSPSDAISHGIAMIHQEPLVFKELNVMENLFMGYMDKSIISWREIEEKSREILKRVGLALHPRQSMQALSVAEQQMVEIGAALISRANIIFMDEPTASLTPNEVDNLLTQIAALKEAGTSVVYISHRLEEIKAIADRVTILRDGQLVGTYANNELTENRMISLMLGHELEVVRQCDVATQPEPYLEVERIGIPGVFSDISFSVKKGEIFGIAGLMGAGRTEVARALFGITPVVNGNLKLDGEEISIKSPHQAMERGIALVPEDRQALGLFLTQSIAVNSTFAIAEEISKHGWIQRGKMNRIAREHVEQFSTKCTSVNQPVGELSGGNQQKVSLAKWIARDPDILILDEPTRGIDIGAKEEVYQIIHRLAGEGKCIILISSEINEILTLCHRAMVMYEGKQTALLDCGEISEISILTAAHDRRDGGRDEK